MRDVIYVKLDIVHSIIYHRNETISQKSDFFETVKSKVIISQFETVRLSFSISPRNLYNSLKSIKEIVILHICGKLNQNRSMNEGSRAMTMFFLKIVSDLDLGIS